MYSRVFASSLRSHSYPASGDPVCATDRAMIAAADSFLRIPARKDIPVEKLPSWIRDAMTQIKPMPVDREVMAAHLDEWMKYWDANIRNRGHKQ